MKLVPYALTLSLATAGCATFGNKSRTPSELKPYVESIVRQEATGYNFPCENVIIKSGKEGEMPHGLARYVDGAKLTELRLRMGKFQSTAMQRLLTGTRPDILEQESKALAKEADILFAGGKNYIYRAAGPDIDSDKDDIAYDFSRDKRIPGPEFKQYLTDVGFCEPKEKK